MDPLRAKCMTSPHNRNQTYTGENKDKKIAYILK